MNATEGMGIQPRPKAVSRVQILVAITIALSLLYAIQYYAGSPIRLPVTSVVNHVAIDPSGSLAAAGLQDGTVRLWNMQSNWAPRILQGHSGAVNSVAFTPNGTGLISAGQDGTLRVWDVSSGQVIKTLQVSDKPISSMSLSANGERLATTGDDGTVRVFDTASWQTLQTIGPNENTILVVALNSDGSQVAAGDGPDIQIWDANTGQAVKKLQGYWQDPAVQDQWFGHHAAVTALAFSPDGQMLVSGSADRSQNVAFWDLESGQVRWMGDGHFDKVTQLVFNAEGNNVYSSSADYKLRIWQIPGGRSSDTFIGHLNAVNTVALNPISENFISGGEDGSVRLWDRKTTQATHIVWTAIGVQPVWGKLFSGWLLFSGLLGLVALWGLWRVRSWGHTLALGLFILGPLVVLGLPILEATSYPISWLDRFLATLPLLVSGGWYAFLAVTLTREPVAVYYEAPQAMTLADQLMVSQRNRLIRSSLYVAAAWILLIVLLYSVLRRFNLDIPFMINFFPFIMQGAYLTLMVSAVSITLAVILALLGALGRLSRNPIANGLSGFYISLIRGTPLLVQVYIWYLGLPRLGIILTAVPAGILALSVNYGAYMTEIFRAGIQAIGKGQHEAAQALGMSRGQTLRRIVLPQAFRVVIPPIGNEFIAMMKDSSLVSLMGVWELTFRAGKIGRQYFRNIETFIIAAAFYWLLTVVFQFLQGNLEAYMARGERR
jgi:polar amino acid transport system permease protein